MALSKTELNQIHLRKLATPNKKYYGDDDKVYIGTEDKRLRLLDRADLVLNNNTNTVTVENPQTIQGAVNNNSNAIEALELELQSTSLNKFKQFTYDVNGNITDKDIYEDSTLSQHIFNVVYTYTGDDITTITVTRISDNFVFTKELSYDVNGNLTDINII
jgi:hypothetical protein